MSRTHTLRRDEVLRTLSRHRSWLREEFGVSSLSLFGSIARDEGSLTSDVDLLVEFDRPTGLFGLFSLQDSLERLLGCHVDVGTADSLKPRVRARLRSASMSTRRWTDRLQDILDAIAEIESFTRGMDLDSFCRDVKTVKAVQLNFIVIGEAAAHIPDAVQQSYPEVLWQLMRAMRNRLVHVYFSIDPQIVWDTVKSDLSPLVEPLEKLLTNAR